MLKTLILIGLGLLVLAGCDSESDVEAVTKPPGVRIGFGSCADDDAPNHKVWDALVASEPDVLLMLGDNVYADSAEFNACLLYTSPSPRDLSTSRMPSSA